jgi:hypothetical protein
MLYCFSSFQLKSSQITTKCTDVNDVGLDWVRLWRLHCELWSKINKNNNYRDGSSYLNNLLPSPFLWVLFIKFIQSSIVGRSYKYVYLSSSHIISKTIRQIQKKSGIFENCKQKIIGLTVHGPYQHRLFNDFSTYILNHIIFWTEIFLYCVTPSKKLGMRSS